ncbi:MAG: hypothetical protein J6P03_07965, partial [Opitutales bacterium]|nr:hypothetical protein [Opitutales bacterium]
DFEAEGGDLPFGLKKCLAYAKEKCAEVAELAALAENQNQGVIERRRREIEFLKSGQMGRNDDVRFQVRLSKSKKIERAGDFKKRRAAQRQLGLPLCPVALSDTPAACAGVDGGAKMSAAEELAVLERGAEKIVGFQEGAGLDMPSFGAFECLDAFEFFASELSGFYFTKAGFVQIRGANVAAPPIIYGDVAGKGGSSLSKIARRALAASKKPLKVSVAGPVSILKRSFARADIPEAELARQLAFAVKEEVRSLQIAGVKAVQIDESMLGDILPLKNKSRAEHLAAAAECFKIAVSDADVSTQILLRLRFNPDKPIVLSLKNMDSDVLILECGGLNLRALELFSQFEYENEIGVALAPSSLESLPASAELERQIRSALKFVKKDRLRIFTGELLKRADAGFTAAFLKNLTEAAKAVR